MIASETVQPELAKERYPQSQLRSPFANPLVIKSNNLVSDSVTVEHRLYDAGISSLT